MRFARSFACLLILLLLCTASISFATTRFIDNGDQTVTDTVTGLMWSKNAFLPAIDYDYKDTLGYIAGMNGANVLGHSDWRLPSISELYSLVDTSRSFPSLPVGSPFINVQPVCYWSSTEIYDPISPMHYEVDFSFGYPDANHDWNNDLLWPVRGPQFVISVLPSGSTGSTYSSVFKAGWGVPPYTWSITSGSLPAGLTLDPATGSVTGTPSSAGTFSCLVQAADANHATQARTMDVAIINASCPDTGVRISGAGSFSSIADAYANSVDNDQIQLEGLVFNENPLFDRNIRVTLHGGYQCGYTGDGGRSVIAGALRIKNGTVRLEGVTIR